MSDQKTHEKQVTPEYISPQLLYSDEMFYLIWAAKEK